VTESVEVERRTEQKRAFAPKKVNFGGSATEVGKKSVLSCAQYVETSYGNKEVVWCNGMWNKCGILAYFHRDLANFELDAPSFLNTFSRPFEQNSVSPRTSPRRVCDVRRRDYSEERENLQNWWNLRFWCKIFKFGRKYDFGGICGKSFKKPVKMVETGGRSAGSPKIASSADFGGFRRKIAISVENPKKLRFRRKIPKNFKNLKNCDFKIVTIKGIGAGGCGCVVGSEESK
jgi:hypothetical protein